MLTETAQNTRFVIDNKDLGTVLADLYETASLYDSQPADRTDGPGSYETRFHDTHLVPLGEEVLLLYDGKSIVAELFFGRDFFTYQVDVPEGEKGSFAYDLHAIGKERKLPLIEELSEGEYLVIQNPDQVEILVPPGWNEIPWESLDNLVINRGETNVQLDVSRLSKENQVRFVQAIRSEAGMKVATTVAYAGLSEYALKQIHRMDGRRG